MNELILDGIVDSVIKELTKTSQNLKTTDSDNDGASDEVEKQAKTNPEDPKDVPDVYDPTDQERKDLVDAYDQFKEKFYQVRKMAQQGNLIRILIAQLQKIQDSQKDDVENSYEKVEDDETKTADTSDTSPNGRLAKKDQLAKKAQEPMLAKEQEEKKVDRKQLQNIKTDVRSFYQEILATKKLLKKAGKLASAGKLEFSLVKEKFIEQMKKIQDDVGEIYNDLILISPAKEIKEQDENPRLAASKKITAVYNEISKMLGPIIDVIKSEPPVPEFRMIPVIDSSLEKLNKIVDFFPSVKAFSGQKGTFEDLENSYSEMIRDMSYLNDNFQNLIKETGVGVGSVQAASKQLNDAQRVALARGDLDEAIALGDARRLT